MNEKQVTQLYTSQLASLKKPQSFLLDKDQNFACFQDTENLYFLMEYFPGGDLATLFKSHRINMSMDDIKLYLAQIWYHLSILHGLNIVYRDLKLENCVIDAQGYVRLVDFGFSKVLQEGERTYTRWGTEGYIAPEIFKNLGHDLKVDIWALGILFWNMVSGSIPNTKDQLKKVYMYFKKDLFAKDLIEKWLRPDPDSRPTIQEIMKHGYFKDIDWDRLINKEIKPYFVPKLEDNYDTKYFGNTDKLKNNALYITKQYYSKSSKATEAEWDSPKPKKFNVKLTQEMKTAVMETTLEQKLHPLGDFKLYRIDKLLRDF